MHVRTEILQPRRTPNPKRQSYRATRHLRALLVLTANRRVHLGCIGIPVLRRQAEAIFFDIVRAKLSLQGISDGLMQAFMEQLAAEVAGHRPADKCISDDERADIARAKECARLALQRIRERSSGTERSSSAADTTRAATHERRVQR